MRGIEVYSGWDDFLVFYNWAIQNKYEDNFTIDRRDNDKGYYPENCRFVTKAVNNKNKRRKGDWGIYPVRLRQGYSILITKDSISYYGGYTKDIELAKNLRDKLVLNLKLNIKTDNNGTDNLHTQVHKDRR